MKEPLPKPQILGRIACLAPMIGAQRHEGQDISVAPVEEAEKPSEEPHATERGLTAGLQPEPDRQIPEEPTFEQDQEARRIAGELVKLYHAGAITGPADPEAHFCARLIRDFGASYLGKNKPDI